MGSLAEWRRLWAPYWELLEDRHLGVFLAGDEPADGVESPTLVIGAEQGLQVERLRALDVTAEGVEASSVMVDQALSRRDLELTLAESDALPFDDESFATVILSTGVIDAITDRQAIDSILDEAMRVLKRRGNLLTVFYRWPAAAEESLRDVGVIAGQEFHWARLVAIQDAPGLSSLRYARDIARWTKRSYLASVGALAQLEASQPPALRREGERMALACDRAVSDGVDAATFLAAVPDSLPYRAEREIRALFERSGLPTGRIDSHPDCFVARCQRLTRRGQRRRAGARGLGEGYGRSSSTAPTAEAAVIRTEAISKGYPGAPRKAVDSLTVAVERGTIFGILGPNGAGKTTTLSMLCGLLRPDSGTITVLDGVRGAALKRRIGYVPQELAIYPKLTGWENMLFFGGLYGVTGAKLQAHAGALLDMVGLRDRRNQLVATYSTGMQRRLNLAAGLIHEPDIILLDEPTVGIDPQSRNCIFEAVLELKSKGVSILYTTHYMEEASRLCDCIVIMDEGKILLEGDPRKAVREYGHVWMELSFAESTSELEAALWEVDFVAECRLGDRVLSVAIDVDQDAMAAARRIIEIAESKGVELTLNSVVEPTLESLFLEITGKSLRDVD